MRIGNNIQTVPPAVYRVYSQIGQKNGQKTIVKFIDTYSSCQITIPQPRSRGSELFHK